MSDQPKVTAAVDEQGALSRELSDFLIQFSIALHRYGMYPAGHPSLGPTVDYLMNHLTDLVANIGTLSLGVARTQLVIEGVATDPKNAVLKDLASRLHRHHIGAITFRRETTHMEVHELLEMIAVDPDRSGKPIGLDPNIHKPIWDHIRMFPVTYDRLRLVAEEFADKDEATRSARTRAAQLWIGLARAAIAADSASVDMLDDDEAEQTDPSVVAHAIDSHGREDAYDQVIVGYMLQIADELKAGRSPESTHLKKRVSELVSTLDKDTLGHMLTMGGDRGQRRQFLLSASEGMAVDAVVDLVQAASQSGEQTVSNSMLRMLQKLAQHAEHSSGRRARVAESSVREQVASLIRNWTLSDPNPDQYRDVLERISTTAPVFAVAVEQQYIPEAERIFQMSLELDTTGDAVERAIDTLLAQDRANWMLDRAKEADAPTARKVLLDRIASIDEITKVTHDERLDIYLLDTQIEHLGIEAADPMIDGLITTESSHTRRLLIDRILGLGHEAGPALASRTDDKRWYVRRNMLSMLSELSHLPPGFDPMKYANDPDSRVRREAFRIILREPETRDRGICLALADHDDHNVRLGLTGASKGCPDAAVPLLIARASQGANTDQRVTAIRVLAGTGSPQALETLITLAMPRRRSLLGLKAPAKSREYLAALSALTQYGDDPRVRNLLARAGQSRDPDVARAALGTDASGDHTT